MNTAKSNTPASAKPQPLTSNPLLHAAQPEPWPEPVEGSALLNELSILLRRFVVLPNWAAETLSLWVLHTYAFDLRDVSTYIGLESPEKRCGKTTLLAVLSELVNRPVVAANISPPAIFRVIEETNPTLLIDEADTLLHGNDELRGILNSGYSRKTAYVVRVAPQQSRSVQSRDREGAHHDLHPPDAPDHRPQTTDHAPSAPDTRPFIAPKSDEGGTTLLLPAAPHLTHSAHPSSINPLILQSTSPAPSRLARFSCWCPKIFAAIGRLPDTLSDRCIVIQMQRKTAAEQCERLRNLDTADLRRRCLRFVQDHADALSAARPELPPSLNDRASDIWEPLLALADLAGSEWPQLSRQAAVSLTATAHETSPALSLLMDLCVLVVASREDRIFSRDLVAGLNARLDRPWGEARRGKAITEMWLAQRLRPYGVKPGSIFVNGSQGRGYSKEELVGVFRRYIPASARNELLGEQGQ